MRGGSLAVVVGQKGVGGVAPLQEACEIVHQLSTKRRREWNWQLLQLEDVSQEDY